MNVTVSNLSEAETLALMKWARKHTSNPNTIVTVSKDES